MSNFLSQCHQPPSGAEFSPVPLQALGSLRSQFCEHLYGDIHSPELPHMIPLESRIRKMINKGLLQAHGLCKLAGQMKHYTYENSHHHKVIHVKCDRTDNGGWKLHSKLTKSPLCLKIMRAFFTQVRKNGVKSLEEKSLSKPHYAQ